MQILNYKDLDKSFFENQEFSEIKSVDEIVEDVKLNGDKALFEYTKKFDGIENQQILVSKEEIQKAYKNIDKAVKTAMEKSIKNVREIAQKQQKCLKNLKTEMDKNILGHNIIPLDSVGCYVPGGNYPLLSSAVMTIIPARVAGVKEIVVCSPKIKDEVIVACDLAGADKIYRIGGAQAISAMAYGTETVSKVDKIVG